MPRKNFATLEELEAYKAEKREYAKQYRAKLKAEGKKPYRSLEAIERENLRAKSAEAKAKRAIRDKIRQSKPEFKAKKNVARRIALREKAKSEGRKVQRWRLTPEEKKLAKKQYWLNWKAKHPEGYEKHKKDSAVRSRNRHARKLGNGGTHTAADIKSLFFEQKGMCGLCDLPLDAQNFHVDHWKPLSKGGSNDKTNLKLLHPRCNLSKGVKLIEKFNVA